MLDEIYKFAKVTADRSRDRNPSNDENTTEGTPNLPNENVSDEDYGPELPPDDEEGRFFGGGISKTESGVLDFVDTQGVNTAPEKFDLYWLRRTALGFEKSVTKNAELRARYSDDPRKFISSEADLDSNIRNLSILSEYPELYTEFVKLGCAGSLVSLLAHENTDIAISAAEIINELIDEDVEANDDHWTTIVLAMLDADLLSLLGSNLGRLDESDDSDRNGVYHSLSILESLLSQNFMVERVSFDERIFGWLVKRIQKHEPNVTQNKQYAAEILAILAQASPKAKQTLYSLNCIDVMLQLVAVYRKKDPSKGGDEEEYMENLFEALTCLVDSPEGKAQFLDAEGIELCLLMLKGEKMSRQSALRLLDHAAGGPGSNKLCEKIVEAGGLRSIFTIFVRKPDGQTTDHILAIMSSMLRYLPGDSAERIRTLAKFVEKEYEKLKMLISLRSKYASKVDVVARQINLEQKSAGESIPDNLAAEWLSRKLEAGLFSLQMTDTILAWLVAEDCGVRHIISELLAKEGRTMDDIRTTILEELEELDPELPDSGDTRDMLSTLAEFLSLE
jgi:beta-catenin-like protein 1